MVATWNKGSWPAKACKCGAVYEITVERLPVRVEGYFDCEICHRPLDRWKSNHTPIFKMKHSPGE